MNFNLKTKTVLFTSMKQKHIYKLSYNNESIIYKTSQPITRFINAKREPITSTYCSVEQFILNNPYRIKMID